MRFAQSSLFLVAEDAYSRSFCEFFDMANVNSLHVITKPNEENIISVRANLFIERVINIWNSLPKSVDFGSFLKVSM